MVGIPTVNYRSLGQHPAGGAREIDRAASKIVMAVLDMAIHKPSCSVEGVDRRVKHGDEGFD
jgi:hypothetical protein